MIANPFDRQEATTKPLSGELDWEGFLKQSVPPAEELYKDSSAHGQDAYLHWLAAMIARVWPAQFPRAKIGRFGKIEPPVHFGMSYRGKPFFIVEWQLAPHAWLPPHCHPNASVCTVGLAGKARIRNFEIIGQAPEFASRETLLVRETHNEVIAQGRINTLSSARYNIHNFQAGKSGARGIDISSLHGPDIGCRLSTMITRGDLCDKAPKPLRKNSLAAEESLSAVSIKSMVWPAESTAR